MGTVTAMATKWWTLVVVCLAVFMSSFPVRVSGGEYEIVEGLEVNDFARSKIDATVNELREERDSVTELGLI